MSSFSRQVPRQVFNADKSVLFWKNEVPQRISVSMEDKRAPGFKAGRESLMLLFCTNTAQFLINFATALIYKAAYVDPWRKRQTRSATSLLVEQQEVLDNKNPFFLDCFYPWSFPWSLDNAPGHAEHYELNTEDVKVICSSSNIMSLKKPLD